MKKTIQIVLVVTLLVGLGLIIMEQLYGNKDDFKIPAGYKKEIVDLSDHVRSDELLFTIELDSPSELSFFIQSDADNEKVIKVTGDSKIIGMNSNELIFNVRAYSGNEATSSRNIVNKGKYSVYITSEQTDGRLAIGYKATPIDLSEYERLSRIDMGDLDNPPEGYTQIYSTELSGLNYEGEVVHNLSLTTKMKVGISVYTSSMQGNVSVDFVGNSNSYYGLVYPQNKICDQLELDLSPGDYYFKVNCEDADGQLYIFIK